MDEKKMGLHKIITFGSRDEMQKYFEEQHAEEAKALESAHPWQKALNSGDCFVRIFERDGESLTIYGEVCDPVAFWADEPKPTDLNELALWEIERDGEIAQFNMLKQQGRYQSRCYSVACPEGEYGSVHAAQIHAIVPRATFDKAKKLGWPDVEQLIASAMG